MNHAAMSRSDGKNSAISGGMVVLCLLISLAGLWNHDLWTPDEPREAALVLSISRTGNVIVPQLAGDPFVEKPPLFYIVAAAGIALLGKWIGNTEAIRLTLALWGLGTLGMTYLIARRLWDAKTGLLAMVVLALMPGFVHVTHWILVDNALMFFVTAAFWCLVEAYGGQRLAWIPLAGICAAGAFLTKGMVGPAVIAVGSIGLLVPWIRRHGWSRLFSFRSLLLHGLALLLLVGLSGLWMLALYHEGGPELWHEWFWNNHIGRFTGQATQLGHHRGVFYYLEIIPLYLLPWLAVWLVGLGSVLRRLWRKKPPGTAWSLLLWWGLGGLALLMLSSTKREIYLCVLLPAFALMIVSALRESLPAWTRVFARIWLGLVLLILTAMILVPVFYVGDGIPVAKRLLYVIVAVAFLGMAAAVMMCRRLPVFTRVVLVTSLTYIAGLSILCPLVDRAKNYGPAFRAMAQHVANDSARVAAWTFDETTRAGFYYYCDLIFSPVSGNMQLQTILNGKHPRFQSVLTLSRRFPPPDVALPPWKVVREERMGIRRRLLWIAGSQQKTQNKQPGVSGFANEQ